MPQSLRSALCKKAPVAALVLLAACAEESSRPNVLVVAVDTLRADVLGCYGGDAACSPNLDALASEGLLFEQAHAHAPWTLPSFASLFTSLLPPEHGAGRQPDGSFTALSPAAMTLAEHFRSGGYATAAVTNVDFLGESFGLGQGFDHLDARFEASNRLLRPADQTTDAALAWLRARPRKPFFLFVHYFDPHAVYDPPIEFRRRFAHPQDRESSWTFGSRSEVVGIRNGLPPEPEVIERARMLYRAEVAFTDREIGRLLSSLDELELAPSTIVVFTSDHGEEFLDHGDFEHGHTLYEELVHVPLVLRYPGRLAPASVEGLVGHVDVAPTLCALAGLPPLEGQSGSNLLAQLGTEPRAETHFAEGNFWGPPLRSWREHSHKLIARERELELYDLSRDPQERNNLLQQEQALANDLRTNLRAVLKGMRYRGGDPAKPSPEELRRLWELGYADLLPEPEGSGR
jgi:arylsulfatase A-like enzyme